MLLKFLIISVIVLDIFFELYTDNVIETFDGPVRGSLIRYENISYYSYQGIPYAESPTGSLRLRPPVPRRPWTEVFDATKLAPVCPQAENRYKKNDMSEDCLRLNIYVPTTDVEKLLPVLVFIHGGAFHVISGNPDLIYGPELLMHQNIILVTINYRLGALGFMSLDIEEASGNAGLKDNLLGLKWIQRNIEKFGGDKNKVTLGGNSSGASIVNFLVLTKHSTNLFHRVIMISGSALSYRAFSRHPVENTMTLASRICPKYEDKYALLKCIQEADVFDIIKYQTQIEAYDDNILRIFTPFLPSREIDVSHAVLTKDPVDILKSYAQSVPILAGFNRDEGIYMASFGLRDPIRVEHTLRRNIEMLIPIDIEYPLGSKRSLILAKKIATFYFDDEFLSNWTIKDTFDLVSDTHYVFGLNWWINLYKSLKDSQRVYFYLFNFDGYLNWSKLYYNLSYPGTSHADETGYLFLTKTTQPRIQNADPKSLRTLNVLTTLFSNFVKHGNPTPQETFGVKWPIYDQDQKIIVLNNSPSLIKMPIANKNRFKFWHKIYTDYYKYITGGGKIEFKI